MDAVVSVQRSFDASQGRSIHIAAMAVTAAVVVATLYFARDVLIPLTLAGLLSFVLAPAVRLLRNARVPRAAAVGIAVSLALGLCIGLGAVISAQLSSLSSDLPLYEYNLREKIRAVRSANQGDSALERASTALKQLGQEISAPAAGATAADGTGPAPPSILRPERETAVVLKQPVETPLKLFEDLISPFLAPLAAAGLVLLFTIFILLQREDLRDRFIRLFGARDLNRTTVAMDDAAARLSRYFVTQAVLNGAFGVAVGVALWLIGIPSPVLWGLLAAIMRFVPYVGSIVAAVFPIALAAAIDPGWTMVGLTALVFIIGEPVMGHIIEPIAFGKQTGLSPLAIVIAATFWTWLWGPIGLILATPLTLCVVVLGQHVEGLSFMNVLLGSEPALTPEQSFYQRLLAGDAAEVRQQAESMLKKRTLVDYYDRVALPGLRLALYDERHGHLDEERILEVREAIDELVETLDEVEVARDTEKGRKARAEVEDEDEEADGLARLDAAAAKVSLLEIEPEKIAPAWREKGAIVVVPARGYFDEAAATMLVQLLGKAGFGAEIRAAGGMSGLTAEDKGGERVLRVVVSTVGAVSPAQLRLLMRRAQRLVPSARILVGDWGLDEDGADIGWMRRNLGAAVLTTFAEVLADLWKAARIPDADVEAESASPAVRPEVELLAAASSA